MNTTHKEKLKIFERKILRSIYGPVQDSNNEWRVRKNLEIEALMKEENRSRSTCNEDYELENKDRG
jgi:hypothetical protein